MPATRAIPALLAVAALGACTTGYSFTVDATRCDPVAHQRLVGMNVGEVLLPPQLHRREIGPGQTVIRDHQPQRLNLYLDAKGWITRVACG